MISFLFIIEKARLIILYGFCTLIRTLHFGLQIKCYMQQLLHGLDHCHSHGVLHRDIKGSNLLIDHDGNLKIGDFGLATFFNSNQKQPLTSRVVTLWYRPPELLLGATDYGIAVDLWSSGCILAELFAGKPIMPGRTEVLFPIFSWI
jgi:serine/threonine protein kinase